MEYFFEHFTYATIFFGLLACGMGLPVPEEVFLLGGGLLVYEGYTEYWTTTAVATVSIMLGDSITYYLGHNYAELVYRIPLARRLLGSEKKVSWVQRHFDEHPLKTVFVARFLAGVRAPTFFFAGGHGVSFWKFFAMDFLGALVSVPTSIWIAWYLGENKEKAKQVVHEFHLWILGIVLLAAVGFGTWLYLRHKKKEEAKGDRSI